MAFEIRKINDVGVGHPVVARLGVQASDLIPWIDIEDAKRKEITGLYARTLTDRLLRCHQLRDDLVKRANEAAEAVQAQKDKRVREVPNVIGLQGIAEGFLYEAKNYLRDLLNLFRIVYGCKLPLPRGQSTRRTSAIGNTQTKPIPQRRIASVSGSAPPER
jgi:hypothetical protein